jgi:glutaconyl-CoA/methylmalonyl-CoA decarboxylase subunit gamma
MKKLRVSIDGKQYDVEVEILDDDDDKVLPSYYYQNIPQNLANQAPAQQAPVAVPMAPRAKAKSPAPAAATGGNNLTSPINGVVLEIPAKVGQTVAENEVVIVLEAMKMKTNISSPAAGVIDTIEVKIGDRVETAQVLLTYK